MSKRIVGWVTLISLLTVSEAAQAGATQDLLKTRDGYGTPVRQGVWHAGLDETRKFAEDNGYPLLAVWSNGDGCSHCVNFEQNVNSKVFRDWMAQSGIVFMFAYSGDPGKDGSSNRDDLNQNKSTGEWCRNSKLTTFPFVRLRWVQKGKVLVDNAVLGSKLTKEKGINPIEKNDPANFIYPGDKLTFNQGGRYAIYYLTNGVNGVFREWTNKPPKPPYQGGEFVTTNTVNACLQALSTTATVNVPLVREGEDETTQTLKVVGRTTGSVTVKWAAGETEKFVPIAGFNTKYFNSGKSVSLQLMDESGETPVVHATTTVACLAAAPGNSSTNPYWLKEKTKDTLAWGEWTMDLDAVTNKVTAWNKAHPQDRAHSLILIGGSRWCPDCVAADEYLFDRAEFKTWAKNNKVVLGVVDIPNYNSVEDGPSLLSYVPSVTSERYYTVNYSKSADETLKVMSGAGYLSRKGIGTNDAAKVIARNRDLVGRNTLEGGWKNPGRAFDAKKRTGVPQLILLRDDGTVAGRFNTFSNFGPQKWDAAYLDRLAELLRQVDRPEEEDNDYARTAGVVPTRGHLTNQELSHADLADYYRIPVDAKGQLIGYEPNVGAASGLRFEVVESVWNAAEKKETETLVASLPESFEAGDILDCEVPSTNCYLKVCHALDSYGNPIGAFACTSKVSTVVTYSVRSGIVLKPTESESTWNVPDGERSVMIDVRKGTTYRLVGLKYEAAAVKLAFEQLDEVQHLYKCIAETGVVGIDLSTDALTYQIWQTGAIGFPQKRQEVSEKAGFCTFKVKRVGGSAGTAKAAIAFDATRSTELEGIWDKEAWMRDYEGKVLTWDEGDKETEYAFSIRIIDNDYADGNQQIVFKLAEAGGYAPVGGDLVSDELAIVIVNDDKPTAGKIGITGCDCGFSKSMNVIAKGGSVIALEVSRYAGADGVASVSIASTGCEISDTSFTWQTRDSGARTLWVTLPPYSISRKTASVKLSASTGAKVDSTRRTLSFTLVPDDVPEFNRNVDSISASRYVTLGGDLGVDVIPNGSGALRVVKYSGTLPPGVSWKFDTAASRLRYSGAPTSAGSYTAVFRVYRGSLAGLTYRVTFDVKDPAVRSEDPDAPYNPNIVKTRTISDIMDIDDRGGESCLYGLMTLTIPRSGKLSAKNRTVDGTYSFSSKGWKEVQGDGTMVAELICVSKSNPGYGEAQITVSVPPDDSPVRIESAMGFAVLPPTWEEAGCKPAAWQGYYTVNLHGIRAVQPIDGEPVEPFCRGDGCMTLKMNTSLAVKQGKMTFAAVLPNGKALSGTSTLSPISLDGGQTYDNAILPLLVDSSSDDLTAVLRIRKDAMSIRETERCAVKSVAYQPYWRHIETGAGLEPACYEALFDAYGSIYDGNDAETFIACCEEKFSTTSLAFFALTAGLYSEVSGAARPWSTNGLDILVSKDSFGKPTITLKNATNPASLKFTFARATGLVNGSFRLQFEDGTFKSLTYKGVVLPGFGTASCSSCGIGDEDSLKAPFIGGSAWFSDVFGYEDARGRARTKAVKRACAVSVGLEAGK